MAAASSGAYRTRRLAPLQVNYRFAGTHGGEWTYRLDTLNVAYGPAPVNLFLGSPMHRVNELASLR